MITENAYPYMALFHRNGLDISEEAYEKLQIYADLLIKESEFQNVTAVRTMPEIWERHFLDSAYLLKILTSGRIIDIGTGGGIPAIPLAILNPSLQITMLDSELRKIEFCQCAVQELGLHAEAVCGRAEELARLPEYTQQFDYAVSRAMASGNVLTEFAAGFLKVGGKLIAMKGRQYAPETERFHEAAAVLGFSVLSETQYVLENETKILIVLQKNKETPAQYPRRFAKIKRSPL